MIELHIHTKRHITGCDCLYHVKNPDDEYRENAFLHGSGNSDEKSTEMGDESVFEG